MLEIAGSDVDTITLTSVLYVPRAEAKMNLLYIEGHMEEGVSFEFAGQSCRMLKHGRLQAKATSSCGVYGMQSASAHAALSAKESAELWHSCFGHLQLLWTPPWAKTI